MGDHNHPGGLKGVFKNDTTLKFQSKFKTPGTNKFKLKVKAVSYKFGSFMHWVFFKPTPLGAGEDPAQTSNAPIVREDAGASGAQMDTSAGRQRTMAATRDMVQGGTPSEQQVAHHQGPKETQRDRPLPAM